MGNKRNILFFIGTSGAGKTYNLQKILKENKNVIQKISNTTRNIRNDEVDGVDYFFQNPEIFNEDTFQKKDGKIVATPDGKPIIEIMKTSEGYYWTTEEQITNIDKDKTLAIILTPEGVKTFVDYFLENKEKFDFDFHIIFYDIPQEIQIARIMLRDENLPIEKIIDRIELNDRLRNETKELIEGAKYKNIFKNKTLIQNIIDNKGVITITNKIIPSNFDFEQNKNMIEEIREKIKNPEFLKIIENFNKEIEITYDNTKMYIDEKSDKKVKKSKIKEK